VRNITLKIDEVDLATAGLRREQGKSCPGAFSIQRTQAGTGTLKPDLFNDRHNYLLVRETAFAPLRIDVDLYYSVAPRVKLWALTRGGFEQERIEELFTAEALRARSFEG
jgi:hypothetical protein